MDAVSQDSAAGAALLDNHGAFLRYLESRGRRSIRPAQPTINPPTPLAKEPAARKGS